MLLSPDIITRLHLYSTDAGGRNKPIPAVQFGCLLYLEGEAFDCRLLLDQEDITLSPGETAIVPMKFLSPQLILPNLHVGSRFQLWDAKVFAEGEVIEMVDRKT